MTKRCQGTEGENGERAKKMLQRDEMEREKRGCNTESKR